MKLYDKVKQLLTTLPEVRNSDKKLLWEIWRDMGFLNSGALYFESLMRHGCPTFESVTRCRRKIQELYPSLRGNSFVTEQRKKKRKSKGTFIYREQYTFDPIKQVYVETHVADTATAVPQQGLPIID